VKVYRWLVEYLRVGIVATVLLACSSEVSVTATEEGAEPEQATSVWVKIDDFEQTDVLKHWWLEDARNDTRPKINNPQITEVRVEDRGRNHYLIKKPAAEGVVGNRKALSYRKLPVAVEVGETYTFYVRFNVEYFPNNHVFGLSNLEPEGINRHDYDALEPSLRVTDKRESDGSRNDGTLMVLQGKGYAKVYNDRTNRSAKPLQTDTWYEVWYAVNNAKAAEGGQVYDVYMRGGEEFPKRQRVFAEADFRMKRERPILYFLANCNTGPVESPYGNGGLRYDDLYMAQGVVLTTPRK
jgi:hypothetical protein